MEFSEDGLLLLGIDSGGTFKVYDIEEKSIIRSYSDPSYISHAADFSPDGKFFVSPKKKSPDILYLWDLDDRSLYKTFKGHSGSVQSICFSSSRAIVSMSAIQLSASVKIEIKIWDIMGGICMGTFLETSTLPPEKIFSSPDGKALVITYPRKVHICSSTTGDFIADLEGLGKNIKKISFSLDGGKMATINKKNRVKIWNTSDGKLIKNLHLENLTGVCHALFTADGNGIILIFEDNRMKMFPLKTVEDMSEFPLDNGKGIIIDTSISTDGRYLACQFKGEESSTCIYEITWEGESSHVFSGLENILASGKKLLKTGSIDEAYETFQKALSIEGYEKNEELLKSLGILEKKIEVKNLISRAEKFFKEKSYEEAEEEYKNLISRKELDAKSRFQIKDRLEDLKLLKQFTVFSQDFQRNNCDDINDIFSPYGIYFILHNEDVNRFINYVKYLSRITGFSAEFWNIAGYIYSAARQFDLALEAFKKAHLIKPENISYHRNYFWALYYGGEYQDALREIKEIESKTGGKNDILIDMAVSMTGLGGNFDQSVEILTEVIKKEPLSLRANLYLGEMLAGINDFFPTFINTSPDMEKAEKYLKSAEEISPYLFRIKSSLEYNKNQVFPVIDKEGTEKYKDFTFFEKLCFNSLRGKTWCTLDTYSGQQLGTIREIKFSDKKHFIVLGKNKIKIFYLYQNKKWLPLTLKNEIHKKMTSATFRDNYIAFCSNDDIINLWQIKDEEYIFIKSWHSLQNRLNSLKFSPAGGCLFSWGKNKHLRMWDIKSGLCLKTFRGHTSSILDMDITSDEKKVLSAGSDKTIKLWSIDTGECLETFTGHTSPVACIKFFPHSRHFVSGDLEGEARIWDINNSACINTFSPGAGKINDICISPDGKYIFFTGSTIVAWNMLKGCEEKFEFCTAGLSTISCSPEGSFVITGDNRGFIRVWHKSVTCELSYLYYLAAPLEEISDFNKKSREKISEIKYTEINTEEQIDYKTHELDMGILNGENKGGILKRTWNNLMGFFHRVS